MNNLLKKLIPLFGIIPLIVGAIGYAVSGEMITDALYASFALYFTNPISDAYNGFIEFARWTAPLVTATAILCVLQNVWKNICWRFAGLSKDSVAVYSDEDIRIEFEKGTKAVFPGDEFKGYFKSQIILFSSDQKSLRFYEEHKKSLQNRRVYIGLRDLEQGLMRDAADVTLFDINTSIARLLWKNLCLWNADKENPDVVIYGNNTLSAELLCTGLQLNLFSKKQHIKYHLISDNHYFETKHPGILLMNDDEICYHEMNDQTKWHIIENADFVIVSEQIQTDLLQTIVVKAKQGTVYYYSPMEGDAGEYISFRKPIPFGRSIELFTDKNIRNQNLIQTAIALNEKYAKEYNGEREWNKLSGFLQCSNISAADFIEVLAALPQSMDDMELAELEHIRWCRFHYLNYWEKGDFTDGISKDNVRRLHKDLIPFGELGGEEKKKDLAVVEMARRH